MLLSLTLIAVCATAILAFVNAKVQDPIKQAKANELKSALSEVIPGFDNDPSSDTALISLNGEKYKVYKATKGGQSIGAAVEATDHKGYAGDVKVLVGFDKDGNIINYSILESGETPGLGQKAKDWFKKGGKGNITGMNPGKSALTVKKDGGNVDAITAATITSRAFLRAVNNAYAAFAQTNNKCDSTYKSDAQSCATKGKGGK